jgi:hypothetical protein
LKKALATKQNYNLAGVLSIVYIVLTIVSTPIFLIQGALGNLAFLSIPLEAITVFINIFIMLVFIAFLESQRFTKITSLTYVSLTIGFIGFLLNTFSSLFTLSDITEFIVSAPGILLNGVLVMVIGVKLREYNKKYKEKIATVANLWVAIGVCAVLFILVIPIFIWIVLDIISSIILATMFFDLAKSKK